MVSFELELRNRESSYYFHHKRGTIGKNQFFIKYLNQYFRIPRSDSLAMSSRELDGGLGL